MTLEMKFLGELEFETRVDRETIKWFGHVKGMESIRIPRSALELTF
jgi:hypothetical protein